MQIKKYKDASKIPEKYLKSLISSEIECWGAEPFDEYKICVSESCKRIHSIEEVHGDIENFRKNKESWDDFLCRECNSKTENIYDKNNFWEVIKEYIKWQVSAVLLLSEEDRVEWFWIISKTNLESLMDNEFNTRPNSYPKEETIKKLSKTIFWREDATLEDVICFHQIYVSPEFRDANISLKLLRELFFINPEYKKIPVVGETRYDINFYTILRVMWSENICNDKYWYVLQYISRYKKMYEFLSENIWFKKVISIMKKFRIDSKNILKENPSFLDAKFYK